jgi:hypothetical protein
MGSCLILTRSKSAAAVIEAYVEQALIPTLRSGQVVVVGQPIAPQGRGRDARAVGEVGLNVPYLLPYSLDLNPFEEAVFKVKGALRRAGARTLEALVDAMDRALDALVARDAPAFFEHCGNRLSVPSL